MTREALDVYWDRDTEPTGQIVTDGASTTFRYDVRTPPTRRVSHSMPVDESKSYPITFFENLLPDGVQRERLARRLGVSDSSTFAMLRAIGGDCAGALSVVPEGEPLSTGRGGSRPFTKELVDQMLLIGVVPVAINEGLRLSLAGAQDKLPVVLDDRGVPHLPGPGVASTHILKLSSSDFRGVCSNEHFTMLLAKAAGIPVADTKIVDLFGREALLVDRFDRQNGARLHQEDVCQALVRSPSAKYESDGGPSLLDVVRLLDEASSEPGDVVALVRWQAFNIAVGNNDGHNKNITLQREPRVRLAPAYDLVCTRAWDQLSKQLAFAVSGVRDAGHVNAKAWETFASAASLSRRLVVDEAERIARLVNERANETAERAIADGANPTAVRNALQHVGAQSARAVKLLSKTTVNVFARAKKI